MADDDDWGYRLEGVTRIVPSVGSDPDDDWPDFSLTFSCDGPNVSAEVEIFVDEVEDDAQVIALALSGLHLAFAAWARVTAARHAANDDTA